MRERLLFLLKTYLWTVVVFVTAKVVFMLCCHEATPVLTVADMKDVIVHGLTLDLSTALYFMSVPFLTAAVSVWWKREAVLTAVLRGYFVLISIAFALAFVADTSLYPFWHYKLDATCLQYLDTPGDAAASVSTGYLLGRLAALIAVAAAIFMGYHKAMTQKGGISSRPNSAVLVTTFGDFGDHIRRFWSNETYRRLTQTAGFILLVPLMVIGIRGGLDESTTNVGQVYYSQNPFLNHSAVNPVFSFLASFENTANDAKGYAFYSQAEMEQMTHGLYDSGTVAGDTLLNTRRPNVVVILLESCGSMFLDVMPHLRQTAAEGIDFTNCYGNSYRTDRGTVCALSGYMSFPTMSVMKMSNKVGSLPSIARSLKREGYSTDYLYGGDINFTKMKGYLISTGFERLHWKQDYTQEEQATSKWGVRDDITFKTLSKLVRQHDDGKPFLIGYSTLSSHEPWDVPVSKYKERQYNGFSYVDDCIGTFLDDMKQSALWDNLLIVFMPDHSSDFNEYTEQHPDRNRIPMIWTGGAVRGPRKLEQICNQSDFAATLLGQMGLSHADFRFSRDVTSRDYRYPFAIHMFNNGVSMVDSTGFMLYDLTTECITVKTSPDAERMARTAKGILQMASDDLLRLGEKQ